MAGGMLRPICMKQTFTPRLSVTHRGVTNERPITIKVLAQLPILSITFCSFYCSGVKCLSSRTRIFTDWEQRSELTLENVSEMAAENKGRAYGMSADVQRKVHFSDQLFCSSVHCNIFIAKLIRTVQDLLLDATTFLSYVPPRSKVFWWYRYVFGIFRGFLKG